MLASTFLTSWFEHVPKEQYIEFTFIQEQDPNKKHVTSHFVKLSDVCSAGQLVRQYQSKGYGAFFGVTPSSISKNSYQRRVESDVMFLPGVWLDLDNPPENAIDHFRHNPPTVIIHSGGGLHLYWKFAVAHEITDDNRQEVKAILKAWTQAPQHAEVNADRATHDLPRVLRVPNTINLKPKRNGAKVQIIAINRHSITSYRKIAHEFKQFVPKPRKKQETRINYAVDKMPYKFQRYMTSGAGEGERNAMLYYASCVARDNGWSQAEAEQNLGIRASADGLTNDEIMRTIASAYRHD